MSILKKLGILLVYIPIFIWQLAHGEKPHTIDFG